MTCIKFLRVATCATFVIAVLFYNVAANAQFIEDFESYPIGTPGNEIEGLVLGSGLQSIESGGQGGSNCSASVGTGVSKQIS